MRSRPLPETIEIVRLLAALHGRPMPLVETGEILRLLWDIREGRTSRPPMRPAREVVPEAPVAASPAAPPPAAATARVPPAWSARPEGEMDLPVAPFLRRAFDGRAPSMRPALDAASQVEKEPVTKPSLPAPSGSTALVTMDDLAVRPFFDRVAWDGRGVSSSAIARPRRVEARERTARRKADLLDDSVREFLAGVSWEGKSRSSATQATL